MAQEETDSSYIVPAREGEGKVTEKMSRFLAFLHPVEDAEAARALVKTYQNKFHDARHICWAYMLGPQRDEWQLNDNGEPSGTAGKPILGQINSAGLTNVIILVVRYFGGIKLGTSGLIAAYREAARLAVEDAGTRVCYRMATLEVTFPYLAMNGVMKIVKAAGLEVLDQQFDNTCTLLLSVRYDEAEAYAQRLSGLDGVIVERQ